MNKKLAQPSKNPPRAGSTATRISPDLQWEVGDEIRSEWRADFLYYNRADAGAIIHAFEAKVQGNGSQTKALGQLAWYIAEIKAELQLPDTAVVPGAVLTGYT